MSPHGYEEINHTADLAIRVWGKDFHALLRNAAQGLYDLMGVTKQADTQIQHAFSLQKGSAETILVDFLNELIYLVEEKQFSFMSFIFQEVAESLRVQCLGCKNTYFRRDIKAATFYNLEISETEKGLITSITFDV